MSTPDPRKRKPGLKRKARLPDLSAFRASLKIKGASLSRTVIRMRGEERY